MFNQLVQMLMNQLKAKNPQVFQTINQARANQDSPLEFFKKATSNYNPEQLNNIFARAEQLGIPAQYIEQVKSSINAK